MIAPLVSRIITPKPAESLLLKIAPSKLALYCDCAGVDHFN